MYVLLLPMQEVFNAVQLLQKWKQRKRPSYRYIDTARNYYSTTHGIHLV
jgi:hypothetical protein